MSIFLILIIDLFITVFIYLSFPVFYLLVKGKVEYKKAHRMALINSIVCALLFAIGRTLISPSATVAINFLAAWFYYDIAKKILTDKLYIEKTGFMADTKAIPYNEKENIKVNNTGVEQKAVTLTENNKISDDKQKIISETDKNNIKRRKTMYNINMEEGEKFYGTYADLLNHLGFRTKTGARFSNYQKSTYELDPHVYVWIASIDGNERNGWINQFEGVDKIVEYNIDNKVHSMGLTHEYRYVFQKCKNNSGKQYFIYKGVYLLNRSMSNNAKRVLEKTDL